MNKLLINKLHRRKLLKILAFAGLSSTSYGLYKIFNNQEYIKSTWTGNVLNNEVRIEIHSNNNFNNNLIYRKINTLINKSDNIFNLQNQNSEIVLLNRNKKLNNPSSELIDVIKKSKLISEQSNGFFDITVQPLWDYYYNHNYLS